MRVDVKIDEPVKLTRLGGVYELRCNDAPNVYPEQGSFLFNWQIIDGDDLEDGSSPIGRNVSDFVRFDPTKGKSEKHKKFIKDNFDRFVARTQVEHKDDGLESEDFVGVEVRARIKFKEEVDGMDNYNITYLPPAVPF